MDAHAIAAQIAAWLRRIPSTVCPSSQTLSRIAVVLLVLFLLADMSAAAYPVATGHSQDAAHSEGDRDLALVVAQSSPEGSVMLDSNQNKMDEVQVDGATYTVYETENMLPYASGLEVYRSGERVTDESEAQQVLRSVAWRRAAADLGPEDIEALQDVNSRIKAINRAATPMIRLLDRVIGMFDWLQENQIAGTSAWDVVTTASPTLAELEPAVRDLRAELQEWKSAADQVNENIPQVVESLERMEQGEEVNHDELASQFESAMQGLDRLEAKSREVSDRISVAADMSATVSHEVQSVPGVGGELSTFFAEASNGLRGVSGDVRGFGDYVGQQEQTLSGVKSSADAEEEQMMNEWEARQTAEMKVYGTMGGGGIIIAGLLFLLFRP